jgi:hypothetical protein
MGSQSQIQCTSVPILDELSRASDRTRTKTRRSSLFGYLGHNVITRPSIGRYRAQPAQSNQPAGTKEILTSSRSAIRRFAPTYSSSDDDEMARNTEIRIFVGRYYGSDEDCIEGGPYRDCVRSLLQERFHCITNGGTNSGSTK